MSPLPIFGSSREVLKGACRSALGSDFHKTWLSAVSRSLFTCAIALPLLALLPFSSSCSCSALTFVIAVACEVVTGIGNRGWAVRVEAKVVEILQVPIFKVPSKINLTRIGNPAEEAKRPESRLKFTSVNT